MGSNDVFRLITLVLCILSMLYMIIRIKRKKEDFLFIFPMFVLVLNIFIKSFSVLYFLPLSPEEAVFYNNWNFVITLQTILMSISMVWYGDMRKKL